MTIERDSKPACVASGGRFKMVLRRKWSNCDEDCSCKQPLAKILDFSKHATSENPKVAVFLIYKLMNIFDVRIEGTDFLMLFVCLCVTLVSAPSNPFLDPAIQSSILAEGKSLS